MKTKKQDPLDRDERDTYEVALRRFEKLPKIEILDWIDIAGSGIAKATDDYRRLGMPDSLQEARLGIIAVMAGIETLARRAN